MKHLLFFLALGTASISSEAQPRHQFDSSRQAYLIKKSASGLTQINLNPAQGKPIQDSSTCFPPSNLQDTICMTGPALANVELKWDAPQHQPSQLYWDNGVNSGGVGFLAGGTYTIAQRFTPADLSVYGGLNLTKVLIHPNDSITQYSLVIYKGSNASTLVLQQPITPVVYEWNIITLTHPVPIDINQELWIGYICINQPPAAPGATPTPAGADIGPAQTGFGDMISFDGGTTWTTLLASTGFSCNWSIHGIIGNAATKTILGYNIYRDGIMINNNLLLGLDFPDLNLTPGQYEYYVKALYSDSCISEPTNTVIVDVLTGISDPYISNCTIYPNPAKDIIHIDMTSNIIEGKLLNCLGKTVLTFKPGNENTITLQTTGLSSGYYIIQLITKDGSVFNKKVFVAEK
jgi:hypothetical protein